MFIFEISQAFGYTSHKQKAAILSGERVHQARLRSARAAYAGAGQNGISPCGNHPGSARQRSLVLPFSRPVSITSCIIMVWSIFSSLPLSAADTTGSPTVGPPGISETTSTITTRNPEENASEVGDLNSYAPDECADRSNLSQN